MKPVRIFTSVWGKYQDYFSRYNLPSIIKSAGILRLVNEGYDVEVVAYSREEKMPYPDVHWKLGSGDCAKDLRDFLKDNLGAITIINCPDHIVGEDSIYNAVKVCEATGKSLSVAHARIQAEKVPEQMAFPLPNRELVELSMRLAHPALGNSKGYGWHEVGNLIPIQYNNASPWAVIFNESDLDFWKDKTFFEFDRAFLRKLKDEGRILLCGSSDLCFLAELTSAQHLPAKPGEETMDSKPVIWGDTLVIWRK